MELPAILALFAVMFPIMWFGGLYAISIIGPWRTLAKEYPHDESVVGASHWFVTLTVGLLSYSNCLTAVSNAEQLTIKPLIPFRPFHPPFTLPRSSVTRVATGRILCMPTVSFVVTGSEIRLFGTVAKSPFWQQT